MERSSAVATPTSEEPPSETRRFVRKQAARGRAPPALARAWIGRRASCAWKHTVCGHGATTPGEAG